MELPKVPPEAVYVVLAVAGGIARYLNSFVRGTPFRISILLASIFISAFSGYIFALVGTSMVMPFTLISMMSGVGGFFSDQAMKWALEYAGVKINIKNDEPDHS